GKSCEIEFSLWRVYRENPPPDFRAMLRIRKWEVNEETNALEKRAIQAFVAVGGEDRQPLIFFRPLEQVAQLDISIAVVVVLHFATLAEQHIGFIEQEERAAFLCGVEDPA